MKYFLDNKITNIDWHVYVIIWNDKSWFDPNFTWNNKITNIFPFSYNIKDLELL